MAHTHGSMQVWPAIDLRGGKCVRLQQGDYGRETIFADDPARMAERWVREGAQQLHLVDLDGARAGVVGNDQAVSAILSAVQVPCELGGGIRDEATIRHWLAAGLTQLVVGTRAVQEPDWFRQLCRRYPGRLVLGVDARDGKVATHGWQETTDVPATDFARSFAGEPLAAVVYTDIAKDGMLAGSNLAAMAAMRDAVEFPVIASGGVTTVQDVRQLTSIGMAGCIIGRALYEGTLSLAAAIEAAQYS